MSLKSFEVEVNPSVLKWARESFGLEIEDAAKKLKISIEDVLALENGRKIPRLSQLKILSDFYKRPLAAFLLPEPPEEYRPKDFRIIYEVPAPKLTKKSLLAIRKAIRLQFIAKELLNMLDYKITAKFTNADLTMNPETLATHERERLGIDVKQIKSKDPNRVFEHWRTTLETQNIFTFIFSMPKKEVRGFSLLNDNPATIVVNKSDAPNAKIFTLFHEYAHLTLKQTGVCMPDAVSEITGKSDDSRIEYFCNQFAGSFLVPSEHLKNITELKTIKESGHAPDDFLLNQIAEKFITSKEVILRRLLAIGAISFEQFQEKKAEWEQMQWPESKKFLKKQSPIKKAIIENGYLFTSLVLRANDIGKINFSNVSDFLSIPVNLLDGLRSHMISSSLTTAQ